MAKAFILKRVLPILFFFAPLLSCAAEDSSYKSAAILAHISAITSGKSHLTDRQYWRKLLKWNEECDSGFDYSEKFSGLNVYRENDKKYIIQVICTLGAYQGYQQFYHLSLEGDKAKVKNLMFPLYEVVKHKSLKKDLSADVWGNVLNDSNYKKLTILNLYSGYGNCGTLTTYKITDGAVRAIKFRSEPDCESETASRDSDKWPVYPIP